MIAKENQEVLTRWLDRWTPSQADVSVFTSIKAAPDAKVHPHVARWYKHIASYASEHASLPGQAGKAASSYIPSLSAHQAGGDKAAAAEDDDEVDLFGSDDEDDAAAQAEIEKKHAERIAAYNSKKAGKVKPAAKSIVTLEVKPWDDETDMVELEKYTRGIEMEGLVWGGSKLVPVGYGINKLQINCVIEDEKVSLDDLQDKIAEGEDWIQSSDVAAMQKL